jgi:LemA protein
LSLLAWIIVGVALAVLYLWYASIVTRRNRVSEALAGIDVQLTQRHDLIPNVLAIAKRFMEHERGLLAEITALRAKASQSLGERDFAKVGDKFAAEERLGADLARLFAVAESYPALKSDAPMIEAQRSYLEVETNIAAARRFYNSAVGDLRNATQIFPGPVLAALAGASTPPPFFEAPAGSHAPVDAGAHL